MRVNKFEVKVVNGGRCKWCDLYLMSSLFSSSKFGLETEVP